MWLTAASDCETMPTSVLMEDTAITNIHVARVQRILRKLARVKKTNPSYHGVTFHQFQLGPPLSEAEVQAFEAEHRIRLPEDYRTFLIHAGNGGAGPIYGLYTLDKYNDFADWVEDEIPDDFLARPCPLYQGMPQTPDWREPFGDTSPYQGTLTLGSSGCTFETQLIISGPYTGHVVYVDANESLPPYISREPDFLAWYERWLDEVALGYDQRNFGYGPGGGELELWQILDDPEADGELKGEATAAFWRLPRLSDETIRRIPALLESPMDEVRSGALVAIWHFSLATIAEHAIPLLGDTSADVRNQAIHAVTLLDTRCWVEPVRKLLFEDTADNVAYSAFYWLEKADALMKPDLLRIITAADPPWWCSSAINTGLWETEDLPILTGLLKNVHREVRFAVLWALDRLREPSIVPAIINMLDNETDSSVIDRGLSLLGEIDTPSTVPTLLAWGQRGNDFNRLAAMEALAKIGDERAIPLAQAMLKKKQHPKIIAADGMAGMSSTLTIAALVRASLKRSPNPRLRALAR